MTSPRAPQWRVVIDCPCCGLPAEITDAERGQDDRIYVWLVCISGRHYVSLPAAVVRRQQRQIPNRRAI